MHTNIKFTLEPTILENNVREKLLQKKLGSGLVLLECLYQLKVAPHSWMTRQQIEDLLANNGYQCSSRLIYNGLRSFLFRTEDETPRANQRGRPSKVYCVPKPSQIKADLEIFDHSPADTLTKADLKSVKTIRLALHRELVVQLYLKNKCAEGVTIFRGWEGDRLGVSARTVRTYDKILGFDYEPNFVEKQLAFKDLVNIPRYKDKFYADGRRAPSKFFLKVIDWSEGVGRVKTMPFVKYLAYEELMEGNTVYKVYRTANSYYPHKLPDFDGSGTNALDYYMTKQDLMRQAGFKRDRDQWFYQRE